MPFFNYSLITALIAGGILFVALPVLFGRGWLLSWLKGCFALLLVTLSLLLFAGARLLSDYESFRPGTGVAKITMIRKSEQDYELILNFSDKNPQRFQLTGDQWQLDARLLIWTSGFQRLGVQNGYQFVRLGSRYNSLDDERHKKRTLYALENHNVFFDFSQLLKLYEFFGLVESFYGNSIFVPLAPEAAYEVFVTETGLLVKPINEAAQAAVKNWSAK